jgi:hypothetical protein
LLNQEMPPGVHDQLSEDPRCLISHHEGSVN